MKHNINRLLAIILSAALLLGLLPTTALAQENTAESASMPPSEIAIPVLPDGEQEIHGNLGSRTYINPLYEGIVDPSALKPRIEPENSGIAPIASTPSYSTVAKAGAYLRGQMTKRVTAISLSYSTQKNLATLEGIFAKASEIFEKALEHTGKPTEGDYLCWQYGSLQVKLNRISKNISSGVNSYTFTFYLSYYTTKSQEDKMNTEVSKVLKQLNLSKKSDYEKIRGIYDYICKNVTYDYEHLYDYNYTLQFTPYAALINKTAVCQGYAALFYRLALELGVDSRLIPGTSYGEPHGWNIVKLGKKYYYADSTWDAGMKSYDFFLKGSKDFTDHTPEAEYNTAAFHKKYPLDTVAYGHKHTYGTPAFKWSGVASCKATFTCSSCGASKILSCKKTTKVNAPATETDNGSITYTATVTLQGKTYQSQKKAVLTYPKSVSFPALSYNGKNQTPSYVTVKDANQTVISATQYTVSYPNPGKNPGKYKAVITFTGKQYVGTITTKYSISKASQKISASNKTKVIGSKAFSLGAKRTAGNGALSYKSDNPKVAKVSSKGKITVKGVGKAKITITAAATDKYKKTTKTVTVTVNPKAISLSKATSYSAGKLTVHWKRSSAVTGYQIQTASNSKFTKSKKSATMNNNRTISKTVSNLKKGSYYYARIRTYKKVSGKNYYSSWSKAKKAYIKKK